jgi:hypothetical protein
MYCIIQDQTTLWEETIDDDPVKEDDARKGGQKPTKLTP